MTILLTAFDPWGSYSHNPTRAVAQALEGRTVGEHRVATAVLPVHFTRAPAMLEVALARHRPRVVLSLGLAASRSRLSLELCGRNRRGASSDPRGRRGPGVLVAGGPEVLYVPMPIEGLAEGLNARGILAEISDDAGGFVCNALLYHALLWRLGSSSAPVIGFLHIPWLLESPIHDRCAEGDRSGQPLPREMVIEGARWILERL